MHDHRQGSKNLKFWCTIFCAPFVDFWCMRTSQKKLAPRQCFSVSCAPYCAPYSTPFCKDFKFTCLHMPYDLMYLKLFVIKYLLQSAGNVHSNV